MGEQHADVGVIGGSGLYSFLAPEARLRVDTPYGAPSDEVTIAPVGDRRVAFLPRHGRGHTVAPHLINSRANLWALRSLGVSRVLAPCAVGSLRRDRAPGDVVIIDQFIDRTHGRADTYFDAGEVAHLSAADPYCDELRRFALRAVADAGMTGHDGGTIVVVQGPRFSSRAESRWFRASGWDLVGMTNYPEVVLARELGLCYAAVCLVTDYDVGLEDDPDQRPVTADEVLAVFAANTERLRHALVTTIERLPAERGCGCAPAPQPLGR